MDYIQCVYKHFGDTDVQKYAGIRVKLILCTYRWMCISGAQHLHQHEDDWLSQYLESILNIQVKHLVNNIFI